MGLEATQPFKIGHLVAAADLSANQYKFVKLQADGTVIAAADSIGAVGVQQNKPLIGDPVTIVTIGITKLVTTAGVTPGTAIGATVKVGYWLSVNNSAEIGTAAINCVPAAAS